MFIVKNIRKWNFLLQFISMGNGLMCIYCGGLEVKGLDEAIASREFFFIFYESLYRYVTFKIG